MIFSSANQFKAKVECRVGQDHVIIIEALTSKSKYFDNGQRNEDQHVADVASADTTA